SKDVIEVAARDQTERNPKLHGRFVGRFGWRGQVSDLRGFVLGACAVELGLSTAEHAEAVSPLSQTRRPAPFFGAAGVTDLSDKQCSDLIAYVASLPPPRRLQAPASKAEFVAAGEHAFEKIGCADCHLPDLGQVHGLYSDLLVHD